MGREYIFNAPAYVVFGKDTRLQLGDYLQKWGAEGNVLFVHGKNVKASGLVDDIAVEVEDYGFSICYFDKVLPDAPVEVIREGVDFARAQNVSAVVAIGGGSAMDIAKAISVMINNKGDILKYAGVDIIPKKRECVFIAIPTTCGTGSEMTDGGVVYDTENKRKVPFWDAFAGPDVAILDPYMLEKLPKHLVAATALDAFAHCAEAYTSKLANPISDAMALGGIELIVQNLAKAYKEDNCNNELELLLSASTMAGMAFNRTNVHAGHAIAHAIGAISHMHHGAACAIVMPYVMKQQAVVVPARVRKIGIAMGMDIPEKTENIGELVAEHITNFIHQFNICSLSQYGVKEEELDAIVSTACKDVLQIMAPNPTKPEDLKKYFNLIY
jgi:alcohol dehydrogenase